MGMRQISQTMRLKKETKGTYVYAAEDTNISSLYIKKAAFSKNTQPPETIIIKVY